MRKLKIFLLSQNVFEVAVDLPYAMKQFDIIGIISNLDIFTFFIVTNLYFHLKEKHAKDNL